MFEQYDINVISLIILAVVLFNNVKNGGENLVRQRLFRCLVICGMVLLVINSAMMILTIGQSEAAKKALFVLQSVFFFLSVLFCEIWAFFCTNRSGLRIKRRGFIVMSVPLFVFTVLLSLNMFNGMIFKNIDEKGPYFHALSASVMFYIGYSLLLIWRGKKNLERRQYYPYLFVTAVGIAMAVAKLVFGLRGFYIWPYTAIGLLVFQLFALDEKINLDHLTGLHNRKYLDAYIEDLLGYYSNVQGSQEGGCFAALMLDIDNFKEINDTFGHVQGDLALISASKILKQSVRRGDFVARYGGDEFMIVLDRCGPVTPERIVRRLKGNLKLYNAESKLPYKLNFSIGCKLFSDVSDMDAKDIFAIIDELMYKNKQGKSTAITAGAGQ